MSDQPVRKGNADSCHVPHRDGQQPAPGSLRSALSLRGIVLLLLASTAVVLIGPGSMAGVLASDSITVEVFDGDGLPQQGIALSGIYPGLTTWHTVVVTAPAGVMVDDASMTVTNLRDYEHGCLRPEREAGDTSCGPGPDQGELSQQLAVHLAVGQTEDADDVDGCEQPTVVVAGEEWLHDLEDVPLAFDLTPDHGAVATCLALGLEFVDLPENNLAMGDESKFDLEITMASQTGTTTEVLGVASEAIGAAGDAQGPGVTGVSERLATTGVSLLLAVAISALMLVAGRRLQGVGRA